MIQSKDNERLKLVRKLHEKRWRDKLGLFYCSANRDETVFTEPNKFDLARSPNPHLGFGGGGPHFCLGAHLARLEATILFEELLPRIRSIPVSASHFACPASS